MYNKGWHQNVLLICLKGLLIQTAENEGENSRIVVVSSEANEFPRNLNFIDDIHFSRDCMAGTLWAPFKIYGASKLCNILFTIELANQLEQHRNNHSINYWLELFLKFILFNAHR